MGDEAVHLLAFVFAIGGAGAVAASCQGRDAVVGILILLALVGAVVLVGAG